MIKIVAHRKILRLSQPSPLIKFTFNQCHKNDLSHGTVLEGMYFYLKCDLNLLIEDLIR